MSQEEDTEKAKNDQTRSKGGYSRLAKYMAKVPDSALFLRFTDLSAESLLHRQAQLYMLRVKLRRVQKEDKEAGRGTKRSTYAYNSRNLRESAESGEDSDSDERNGDSPEQWMLMKEIRELLNEYYSALTLHHQIVNINKPHPGHLESLRDFMNRYSRGNMYLTGVDRNIWSPDVSSLDDFVTMEPTTQDGITSSRSTLSLVKVYHSIIGRHLHKAETDSDLQNTILYPDEGVLKVIRMGKALTASMLPIVSIVILHFVKETGVRLGVIAALTAVFSLTLCYFTSASINSIFSATAAFSAVLVVFVGATIE